MTTTETETPSEGTPSEEKPLELEAAAPEPTPFWQRPNIERYLFPLVLPIAILIGLGIFIINVSRIFLAGHGESAVIIGSCLTAGILIGAALLSAAPKMRSSSIALITGAFVASIVLSGWLSLGSAEPDHEEEVALPDDLALETDLQFTAPAIVFEPDSAETQTGLTRISLSSTSGSHTLVFDQPDLVVFRGLEVSTDSPDSAPAFIGDPGDYGFHCTIPGHENMRGTIAVTGEPVTLEAALAEVEGAGGEGGEAPAEGTPPAGEDTAEPAS